MSNDNAEDNDITIERVDNDVYKNHRVYSEPIPSVPLAPPPSSSSAALSSSRFVGDEKDSIIVSLQEEVDRLRYNHRDYHHNLYHYNYH